MALPTMRNNTHPLLTHLFALISSSHSALDTSGALLARTLSRLAEHEVAEGGPYALTPGGGSGEADLGLNVAVAVFLNTYDVQLPKLDAFIDECLASDNLRSQVVDDKTLAALLGTYRKSRLTSSHAPFAVGPAYTPQEQRIVDRIRDAAQERFSVLPDAFATNARAVIERTVRGNPDKQMSLMPLYVRTALGKKGKRFSDKRLAEFGLANVFFWTAFIIYDDFWDEDEAAEPKLLPVANLFARHYVRFFETVQQPKSAFSAFFHELMDRLDAANEWEMLSCRLKRDGDRIFVPEKLPEYGDFMIKFYPAAGHVLGPIAMLVEQGYAIDSEEVREFIEYFRHYLVAMQLNDDAHDWKEDLSRGHISTAVYLLLEAWKEAHPECEAIDIVEDMPELERLFWFETITPLCETVLACTRNSRAALDSLDFLEDPGPLEEFIMRNEHIAIEALHEQERSLDFLGAING